MTQNKETAKDGPTKARSGLVDNTTPLIDDQTVVTFLTLPPDGGWGWVVVAASFYCSFFTDGIINTAGLFIGRLDEDLGVSKTSVSLMGSSLSGVSLLVGPFVSAFTNRFGFRTTTVIGGVIACAGFAASAASSDIEVLWLTYGVVAGIGFGMIYTPAVISVGFYFERWRSLASSIAACGAGFGTVLLAPITSYLLDTYGWRNTILAQAGMMLSCGVIGLSFRPLLPVQVTVPFNEEEEIDSTEDNNNKNTFSADNIAKLTIVKCSKEELKKEMSNMSVNLCVTPSSAVNRFLKTGHNDKYATVHDILSNNHCSVRNIFNVSTSSVSKSIGPQGTASTSDVTVVRENILGVKNQPTKLSNSGNSSEDHFGDSDELQDRMDDVLTKHLSSNSNRRRTSVIKLLDAGAISDVTHFRKNSAFLMRSPRPSMTPSDCASRRLNSRRATITSGVRPLYKDDIFFGANLKRLPQYSSKNSRLDYAMTVTRLPTLNDVLEEETCQCILCPEAVKRTLATMLDMSLLTSPSFFLLCFSGFITNMGFYIPFMYLESRIKEGGLDPDLGKWFISTIGVSNTIGRAVCGLVCSLPNVSAMFVNNVMLTLGGVATILSGIYMTVPYQFIYAIVFGFSVSAFSALRPILTVEIIGLEKLTNGFGIMLLYQGVSAGVGPPLAGLVMERTHSYNVMFAITGILILLSAVLCYPLERVNRWEKVQKLKQDAKAALEIEIA